MVCRLVLNMNRQNYCEVCGYKFNCIQQYKFPEYCYLEQLDKEHNRSFE